MFQLSECRTFQLSWLCIRTSTSNHTVYSRAQLSMVPLWFSNQQKKQQLFLMMFIRRLQHLTLAFISALGYFLLLLFLSLREWTWQMIKIDFIFSFFFGKRSKTLLKIWGKKYVERDCCVVNSCHLCLKLCVSLFWGLFLLYNWL